MTLKNTLARTFRNITGLTWLFILFFMSALSFFNIGQSAQTSDAKKTIKIGIIQLIEHPALDQTRQGVLDTLKARGIAPENCKWETAQGNIALLTQITQKFIAEKVDVLITIPTLAAQTAMAQTQDNPIPIVFASVTDPEGAKLKGKNITGVSNYSDPKYAFEKMRTLYPEAKTVGIIYNTGEPNSVSMLSKMRETAPQYGFSLVESVAMNTSSVSTAAKNLMSKSVDLVFINNDNTALAGFTSVVSTCQNQKVPVIVSDIDLFDQGADVAYGPDQYKIGCQAAEIAYDIISKGKSAGDIPVVYPQAADLVLRKK